MQQLDINLISHSEGRKPDKVNVKKALKKVGVKKKKGRKPGERKKNIFIDKGDERTWTV